MKTYLTLLSLLIGVCSPQAEETVRDIAFIREVIDDVLLADLDGNGRFDVIGRDQSARSNGGASPRRLATETLVTRPPELVLRMQFLTPCRTSLSTLSKTALRDEVRDGSSRRLRAITIWDNKAPNDP
jgi:hypothetical protein